jgi:hypothetical protein
LAGAAVLAAVLALAAGLPLATGAADLAAAFLVLALVAGVLLTDVSSQ